MKTRSGFVSNSSTTSFCIYGIHIDSEKLFELIAKNQNIKDKLAEMGFSEEELDDPDMICEIIEAADPVLNPLEVHMGPDYIYLGTSLKNFRDDETGAQSKKRVREKIKEILGKDFNCSILEEAWRDG